MQIRCSGNLEGEKVDERANSILRYWLGNNYKTAPRNEAPAAQMNLWFRGGPAVDEEIKEKFSGDLEKAESGKLDSWRSGYNGLAAVILMDQFTRNCYRGTAKMCALDHKAVTLAKAIHEDGVQRFPPIHRVWLYMTLMHAESVADQELCVERFKGLLKEAEEMPGGEELQKMLKGNVDYAQAHLNVVKKWGRFPHRNKILGREDTAEEIQGFKDNAIPSF